MLLNERSKVLIVDDERRNLIILTELLRDSHEVTVAKCGKQALEKANKLLPDLILLDIIMPDMNGFEVLTQLKKNKTTNAIPVIFITGLNAPDEERKGLTLGAQDYIYKPFSADVVKARVATQLKIIEQAKQLQQAKLKEKMASLGTLTAGVAHEINNPVNFAHVSADNLTADVTDLQHFIFDLAGDSLDQEVRDEFDSKFNQLFFHIKTIKEGTSRIKDLVEDLWSITLHDNPDKTDINIVQMLQSALAMTNTNLADVATFSTQFDELPTFYGYPGKLNQVFINVLLNACEAVHKKHLTHSDAPAGVISVHTRFSSGFIEIAIQDNGCGMNETSQQKIFEPFYTTKEVGEGTGLGMSMAFAIVEEQGGTIKVKSTLDKCSLITIYLPVTT